MKLTLRCAGRRNVPAEQGVLPSPDPKRDNDDVRRSSRLASLAVVGLLAVTGLALGQQPLPSSPNTSGTATLPPVVPVPTVVAPGDATSGATEASPTYVFPVFGTAVSYTNDYGAPRAGTGSHYGNDLFAPTGTPVLAVADGELYKVGVNTLGGNRLWLRDGLGNTYYYAHLSGYASHVKDGVRVKKGEIIAYVGNTGQAITTPPHLHFEIHPGDGDAVNPYPFLQAWQHGTEIPKASTAAVNSRGQAPLATGAVLVGSEPEEPPADPGTGEAIPVS